MIPDYFRPFALSVVALCLSVLPLFGPVVDAKITNPAPERLGLSREIAIVKKTGFFKKIRLIKDLQKKVKGQAAGFSKRMGGTFLLILLALLVMAGLIWFASFVGVGGMVFGPVLILVILAIAVFGVIVLRGMKRTT